MISTTLHHARLSVNLYSICEEYEDHRPRIDHGTFIDEDHRCSHEVHTLSLSPEEIRR